MMKPMRVRLVGLLGSLCLLTGCGSAALGPAKSGAVAAKNAEKELSPDARLARGLTRLAQSRYADAEADLNAALSGSKKAAALLALSELMLTTGRYPEAIEKARLAQAAGADTQAVAVAEARALRRSGE